MQRHRMPPSSATRMRWNVPTRGIDCSGSGSLHRFASRALRGIIQLCQAHDDQDSSQVNEAKGDVERGRHARSQRARNPAQNKREKADQECRPPMLPDPGCLQLFRRQSHALSSVPWVFPRATRPIDPVRLSLQTAGGSGRDGQAPGCHPASPF